MYADALEMADRHVIYKNGAKEIAALNGRSLTFMAKYSMDEVGSSCHVHSSVWDDRRRRRSLMWDDDAPDHLSDGVPRLARRARRDAARELAWMFAPTVNSYKRYQPESWAPTALAWGATTARAGFRVVGHGAGLPRRVPHPRRRRQPVPRVRRRRSPPACTASSTTSTRRRAFDGNAYEAPDVPRVPSTLVEAIDAVRASRGGARPRSATTSTTTCSTPPGRSGASFNPSVTDWELRRSFERL